MHPKYLAAALALVFAAVLIIIPPRAIFRAEKALFGVDRLRMVSNVPRWETMRRAVHLIVGIVFLFVAAYILLSD